MTIDLPQLFVLGLVCASAHWLIARSHIAEPLWSRARGWLGALLRCPACSGVWLGLGCVVMGIRPVGHGVVAGFVTVMLTAILTPVFEAVMLWGLERSAIEEEEVPPPSPDVSSSEDAVTPVDRPQI